MIVGGRARVSEREREGMHLSVVMMVVSEIEVYISVVVDNICQLSYR